METPRGLLEKELIEAISKFQVKTGVRVEKAGFAWFKSGPGENGGEHQYVLLNLELEMS